MAKNNTRQVRGVEAYQELRARQDWRDLRSPWEHFRNWLADGDGVLFCALMALGIMWEFPALMEPVFLVGMALLWWASGFSQALPYRLPATSAMPDPNDPHLATGQPQMAAGITFLGNELKTQRELWFKSDDVRTHILIFGSTGAGKTEALLSMAYNTLLHGSGFIYIDGKGTNDLWAQIFSMCRALGREDDLLIINYMTSGRDVFGPQKTRQSNTLNPFAAGSSGALTELFVSLMDSGGGGNNGDMWKGRAIALASAVIQALCWMRDQGEILLGVDVIREYIVLDKIISLAQRRDIPANILAPVRAYLQSLGYQENPANGKQPDTVSEQHGYVSMQFTKILGSLADTYGYIYLTDLSEVDLKDVVINRRILCVLLPALEKSPDELGNLGKIIVASLKSMMATGLGDKVEGDYDTIVANKPTNAPTPYLCILDEYGYYVVKGASVMPAQARSLGFCMVFAGQDFASFKKNNNQEEADATQGNCNIKIWMKIEDPRDTFTLCKDTVGEAQVSKTTGFTRDGGLGLTPYSDQQGASIERRGRVDWLDLKDQNPGEAHVIFKSTLVRARLFRANPRLASDVRINYFLRVKPPEKEEIDEIDEQHERMLQNLRNIEYLDDAAKQRNFSWQLSGAAAVLDHCLDNGMSCRDAAVSAMVCGRHTSLSNMDNMSRLAAHLSEMDDAGARQIDAFVDEQAGGPVGHGKPETGKTETEKSRAGKTRAGSAERAQSRPGKTVAGPSVRGLDDDEYLDGLGDLNDVDDEASGGLGDGEASDEERDAGEEDEVGRIMMDVARTRERLAELEEAGGVSRKHARARAAAITDDARLATRYPKNPPRAIEAEDLVGMIQDLTEDMEDAGL